MLALIPSEPLSTKCILYAGENGDNYGKLIHQLTDGSADANQSQSMEKID